MLSIFIQSVATGGTSGKSSSLHLLVGTSNRRNSAIMSVHYNSRTDWTLSKESDKRNLCTYDPVNLITSLWMDLSWDVSGCSVEHCLFPQKWTSSHSHIVTHKQVNTGPQKQSSSLARLPAITDSIQLPLCCVLALTCMPVFVSEKIHLPPALQSIVHCTSLHMCRVRAVHNLY